jgi:hypothetical protein
VSAQQFLDSKLSDIHTPVMIWIDNYQVFQARVVAYVNELLWRNSKMCAVAGLVVPHDLSDGTDSEIDFKFQYYPMTDAKMAIEVIPAVPTIDELFTDELANTLGNSFNLVLMLYKHVGTFMANDDILYYPDSFVETKHYKCPA